MTTPEHLAIIEQGARENNHLLAPCYLRSALVHMKQLVKRLDELENVRTMEQLEEIYREQLDSER